MNCETNVYLVCLVRVKINQDVELRRDLRYPKFHGNSNGKMNCVKCGETWKRPDSDPANECFEVWKAHILERGCSGSGSSASTCLQHGYTDDDFSSDLHWVFCGDSGSTSPLNIGVGGGVASGSSSPLSSHVDLLGGDDFCK